MTLVGDSAPPTSIDDPGHGDEPDDGRSEPWWHSPWRLAVMAVAVLFLGGAIGYALTAPKTPSGSSVDVGFLQDMRSHHDQAVEMAYRLLTRSSDGVDPVLRTMAGEILLGQQLENGLMVQQLRTWGQVEQNESGTAMTWMGMPVPVDQMPGMASAEQVAQLATLPGKDASVLFARLMIAHHEGGLHMASDASARATSSDVRVLANAMVQSQTADLAELRTRLSALTAGG